MIKICSKCGEEKAIINFYKDSRNKDGYNGVCKQCIKIRVTNNYKQNSTEIIAKQKLYRNKNPCRNKATKSIYDHARRGCKIDIDINTLASLYESTILCPICGCIMTKEICEGHSDNAQTLDRINNEKEININNVWIICHRCNTMKGNFTMKEFVERSRLIYDKFRHI